MHKRAIQLALIILCCVSILTVSVYPVGAQSPIEVTVFPPITGEFPNITTFLDVHDAQGSFVAGLQLQDIRVFEDDLLLTNVGLTELTPGVQFVLAIAPGDSFAIRDARGVARYDYIADALRAWGRENPDFDGDDLSFIADGAPETLHLATRQAWLDAFEAYQLPAASAEPTLSALARAVEIAAETPPREGMERVVLFLTPPQGGDLAVGLQTLGARARQAGVRICVWLLASTDFFTAPGTLQLQTLANETGGQFFAFANTETIPSVESYLSPHRSIYRLVYESQIVTSGTHQLSVEVTVGGAAVRSEPQAFGLTIQPPNPIFISPPTTINRAAILEEDEQAEPVYFPAEQSLKVHIEFPDGFTRAISQTILYVDNLAVAANLAPPFDEFTWDLSQYADSGSHLLRVEVVDTLGLSGFSVEAPVQIIIQRPQTGVLATLSRRSLQLAGAAVLVAGAVLGLVLILGGRIRPRTFGQAKSPGDGKPAKKTAEPKRPHDPVTQPVEIRSEPAVRRLSGWRRFPQAPRQDVKPVGYLMPIVEPEEEPLSPPIPITAGEMTFGRDPDKASQSLDDPSVEPLHARLRFDGTGYRISDAGSVAGTWVNYTPVSTEGASLENGDLIHIGRVGFRFTLREPGRVRRPVIMEGQKP